MPRPGSSSSPPREEQEPGTYKRPCIYPSFRLKRDEVAADLALIRRLVREAKNNGIDSGSAKSTDSPRAQM